MTPFIMPLVITLPQAVRIASKATRNYLDHRANNYCKEASLDDCNSAKKFNEFLAPIIGGTTGFSAGVFLVSFIAPEIPPLLKTIETIAITIALGTLGAVSSIDSDHE